MRRAGAVALAVLAMAVGCGDDEESTPESPRTVGDNTGPLGSEPPPRAPLRERAEAIIRERYKSMVLAATPPARREALEKELEPLVVGEVGCRPGKRKRSFDCGIQVSSPGYAPRTDHFRLTFAPDGEHYRFAPL